MYYILFRLQSAKGLEKEQQLQNVEELQTEIATLKEKVEVIYSRQPKNGLRASWTVMHICVFVSVS